MEKQSLLSLTKEYQEIENVIMRNDGEVTPEIESWLKENETRLLTKVDACAFVLEKLNTDAEYFKEKAKQWTQASRAYANASQRLKDRIKFVMREIDSKELSGEDQVFKLSSGRKKIVLDESKIPPEFFQEVITRIPNMELIETAIQNGIELEGVKVEDVYSLRVAPKRKEK